MTTLIVSLIIAVLFSAGVGLLVMEHVVARRQRRVFDDIPIDRLFEALDNWWDNAPDPLNLDNYRGNFR